MRLHRGVALERAEPGLVSGRGEFGEPYELETDAVVLVTQRVSDEALYLELTADEERLRAEGIEAVYRIGDCVAPQLIADAIFDGHRLAREIDADDPSVPLPWRPPGAGGCVPIRRRTPLSNPAEAKGAEASPLTLIGVKAGVLRGAGRDRLFHSSAHIRATLTDEDDGAPMRIEPAS